MVHRDVKSANVLLQRDYEGRVVRAVLADFGLPVFIWISTKVAPALA
jgi:serine/threonine protein kinase